MGEVEVTLWTHTVYRTVHTCIQFNLPHKTCLWTMGGSQKHSTENPCRRRDEHANSTEKGLGPASNPQTSCCETTVPTTAPPTVNNLCLYVFKPSVGTRCASEDSWLPAGWEEGSALCLYLQTCGQMLSWREEDRFRSDWTKAVVTVV